MKHRLVFVAVGATVATLIVIFVTEYTFLEPILFGHYETYLKSTILYNKISDEQWIQMYSNHTGVKYFVERFENHTTYQELNYGQKKIVYKHTDHNITTQLIIYVGANFNDFVVFHCAYEEGFGWSIPMHHAIFMEDLDCHKILPRAKKFLESQELVNGKWTGGLSPKRSI